MKKKRTTKKCNQSEKKMDSAVGKKQREVEVRNVNQRMKMQCDTVKERVREKFNKQYY